MKNKLQEEILDDGGSKLQLTLLHEGANKERKNKLQEEILDDGGSKLQLTLFNEMLVINSPKQMEVERKNGGETRIKICCRMKPGLLLSTIDTVEELGLEIQQCVISCFSDFKMHASCSQELKERDAEDIKQALFRKAEGNSGSVTESSLAKDEKNNQISPFMGFMPIDSPDGSCIIKERMAQALGHFKDLAEQHVLAQVWATVKNEIPD